MPLKSGHLICYYYRTYDVLTTDPNFLLAYYYRAEVYSAQEKHKLALDDLNNVIRIEPKHHDAYIRRGNIYRDLDAESAMAALEALGSRSRDIYRDFNADMAISDYTAAIKIDPASWLGYYNRGATLMSIKEYELAIDDLTKAIVLNPKYASAYSSRGLCYCRIGQKELSRKDFNRARELGAIAALICN